MSDFSKTLLNIRRLRSHCRKLTLEQLEMGVKKLSRLVEELRCDQEREAESRSRQKMNIAQYLQNRLADGISPGDLFKQLNGKSSKHPARYRYWDERGVIHTWNGYGRQPQVIQRALHEGHRLDEFLIRL
ncbi:H-NS family histone-like protein [Dongshaea marina]|uniref:H-NS family histone-like protein n=1 Tax=Dongshaea marina TaxID=2047966 RepID=UPI00131F282F|nr:H-NS family nucleoid-associated regulatory protein [Dongshaea marina]